MSHTTNNESQYSQVIAIDGPSGSGKSTIARELARALNVLYIDTGAMFRALGFYADEKKIDLTEGAGLTEFLNSIKMDYGVSDTILIRINGIDLTDKIREHNVSKLASVISQLPSVRKYLLDFQRNLALDKVCVMEGRDIGTVVFPHSFSKFFITASVDIRAERRLKQLQEGGDKSISLEQIKDDVRKRDETDMNRVVAPLKKAEDAMLLDTSDLALSDIINILANEVKFRASHLGFNL
ncbi:MAG: (d)CMP kinase [Bdellovibrionales bacterium]|nr:(d)CMP kinase [Bdellovibrionales bacterium]